ncbi:MAG: Ldh family oxidoreductase, partial [bacterium]
ARIGKPLPEGLVIDENGDFMTNPDLILGKLTKKEASLLPVGGKAETGGYKGYGHSTVVEILSSALQGGAFLQAITGYNVGHFFMAINIEAFIDLPVFKKNTGDILRALRGSKRMPNEPRIYTAGEKEYLAWLDRKDKGAPINESIQKELIQMRDELGLKTRFCFES